jgi:uncharacterized protein (TIGR02646 family)
MKYIKKGDVPAFFREWRTGKGRSLNNWNDFSQNHHDVYQELKEHLLSEQLSLCCYCESCIDGRNTHIEHLKPKSSYQTQMFNFDNLLVSCGEKDHCGRKKLGEYFVGFVSPLALDCEERFIYTERGEIIPTDEDDADAIKTIEILGLNDTKLKGLRRSIIKALGEEVIDADYLKAALSNCAEWHNGFYTVIQYLLSKKCGEAVIR